jgi:hypothetical protein
MGYAQDVNPVAKVGQTVTFDVTASGTAPFTYQWKKGERILQVQRLYRMC